MSSFNCVAIDFLLTKSNGRNWEFWIHYVKNMFIFFFPYSLVQAIASGCFMFFTRNITNRRCYIFFLTFLKIEKKKWKIKNKIAGRKYEWEKINEKKHFWWRGCSSCRKKTWCFFVTVKEMISLVALHVNDTLTPKHDTYFYYYK